MANNENRQDKSGDQSDQSQADLTGKKRVIGEGMSSLDSTQAPLKAETGEPDWDAVDDKFRKEHEK